MGKELSGADLARMGLLHAALTVEARDCTKREESTLFDIATETGRDRLIELLDRIQWATPKTDGGGAD